MPTSTAMTASSGTTLAEGLEHERRVQATVGVGAGRAARPSRRASAPTGGRTSARRSGRSAAGTAAVEQLDGAGDVAPQRAPRRGGTCRGSCGRGRPGWWAPRSGSTCGWRTTRPSTSRQSALATVWLATGMPERPRTPQPSGWSSGIVPLALKVEITGRVEVLGEARAPRRGGGGRRCRRRSPARLPHEQLDRRGAARRPAGAMAVAAMRPAGSGRRVLDAGELLHLVGQHEVGDVALHDGVLHGQRRELGGVARREDGLAPLGDRSEGLVERQLLERRRARSPGSAPGR